MPVQPIDYSFIAQAGSQLGNAIASIPEEKRKDEEYKTKKLLLDKQLKQLDINENVAYDIYYKNIEAAAKEWDDTIGDGRGIIMARQMYPETMIEALKNPEKASEETIRLDDRWTKFLEKNKVEKFRGAPATISTEGPAGPGYQPSAKPQVSVGPDRGLPEIQGEVENQMLSQPRTEVPRTAADMYSQAQNLGITETPQFKSDYQQQQNIEAGMLAQPGQTQSQYKALTAAEGIDPSTGAAKEIGSSMMTENQIAIDERQRYIADQRNRLREVLGRMQEARLRAQGSDKNTLRLLDSQIRAVQAQIDASQNRSKMALGIQTGKDPFYGTNQYSTGPEWQAEMADAESTYTSAQKLLEYIDELNKKVNPIPGAAPVKPAGSKFTITNVRNK